MSFGFCFSRESSDLDSQSILPSYASNTSQAQDCRDTKDLTGTGHQVPTNVQNWARKNMVTGYNGKVQCGFSALGKNPGWNKADTMYQEHG